MKTELSAKNSELEQLRHRVEEHDTNSEHSCSSSIDTKVTRLESDAVKLRDVIEQKDARITSLNGELQSKTDLIVTMEKQLHEKHKELVTKLTQDHLDKFDDLQDTYAEKCHELEQTRQDLQEFGSKYEALEKSQQARLDELRTELDTKRSEDILSLETQHSQKVEELHTQHQEELEQLKTTMSAKHNDELTVVKVSI